MLDDTALIKNLIKTVIPKDINSSMIEYCRNNLDAILNSRFDNPFGKKALAFLNGRAFVYKRDNCYVAYTTTYSNKHKAHMILCCTIYPVSTPNGKIYAECTVGRNDCYTGHYFDQYAVRTGLAKNVNEANMKRDSIVKAWLIKEILETRTELNGLNNNKHGYTLYKYHPDGMGLGIQNNDIQLFKTFVSTDMLKNDQVILNNELASEPDQISSYKDKWK